MYEIEHRTLLTQDEYNALKERLLEKGVMLGEDNKEVSYYIYSDKLLKIVHNISKKTAKISLKLNALGSGSSFKELEVEFPEESTELMNEICGHISGADQVIQGTQQRTNFKYQNVDIALKWSEDWSYHAEFEMMISDLAEKEAADNHIKSVAESLGVTLMTEEEVAVFITKVREAKKTGGTA
jgi:adenylate cyclase class IV